MSDLLERLARKLANPLQKLERVVRQTGKVSKLQKLLKNHKEIRENINTIRFKGFTCLHLCCLHGYEDCVEYLLTKAGADCNVLTADDGSTPLHMTCWSGNLYIILMLSQGCSISQISCVNKNGYTPLHYSCAGGHAEVYEFLIDHGADVTARTLNEGFTPLLISAYNNQLNAVQYLIDCSDIHVDEIDAKGRTSLMLAVAAGNLRMIRYLLKAGADINAVDDDGKRPINYCSASKDNQSKRLLESYIKNGMLQVKEHSKSTDSSKSPTDSSKVRRKSRRSLKSAISSGSSTSSGSSDTPNDVATASTSTYSSSSNKYNDISSKYNTYNTSNFTNIKAPKPEYPETVYIKKPDNKDVNAPELHVDPISNILGFNSSANNKINTNEKNEEQKGDSYGTIFELPSMPSMFTFSTQEAPTHQPVPTGQLENKTTELKTSTVAATAQNNFVPAVSNDLKGWSNIDDSDSDDEGFSAWSK